MSGDDAELRERIRRTAQKLFHSLEGGTGFETWKKFDRGLARELSMFFTGYGGMPVVVDALDVFKAVLEERGEWEP
jgi:hypothetical protein